MPVKLLVQWCEAAGLWLSVQKHIQGRQNYTRFKCCFRHSAQIVQNGATMVATPSLNCTRLLLQAVTFLRTKCNMCKCTLFQCPSVNVWYFPNCGFFACDRKCVIFLCAQSGLHAYWLMCVWVSLVELWTKGLNLRVQGPADLSWTSSFFFFFF